MPFTAPETDVLDAPKTIGFTAPAGDVEGFIAPKDDLTEAEPPIKISHESFPGMVSTTDGGKRGGGLQMTNPTWNDLPDKESVSEVMADVSRPAIAFPKFTVNPDDSRTKAVAKSVANLAISLPEFLTSPLGIASGGAAGVIPRLVAAGFLADTGKSVVEQSTVAGRDWDAMTPAQRAAAVTDLGGTTVLAAAMAHGTTKLPVKQAAAIESAAKNLPDATVSVDTKRTATPEPVATQDAAQPVTPTQGEAPATSFVAPPADHVADVNTMVDPTVRTPDGKIDLVQTALNKIRQEGEAQEPPAPAAPVELSQLEDLQATLRGNQGNALLKPSESQPVKPAKIEPTSQPAARTATPPAPVASDSVLYQQLVESIKGKSLDEAQPIIQQIEQIKARNGGSPPKPISQPEVEAKNAPARSESSPAVPEQSSRDIDEMNALETVQEAVGLNKAQQARLTELQNRANKGLVAPETDTVGTALNGTHEQIGSTQSESGAAITAEGGKPRSATKKLSPGLTTEDGHLFTLTQDYGKIPAFLPDGMVIANYRRLKNKLANGGVLSPKERSVWQRVSEIFPANFEDNFGVNGEKFRRAYDAAKKAGIAGEIFVPTKSGSGLTLEHHLDALRQLTGKEFNSDQLWAMVEQASNEHHARAKGKTAQAEDKYAVDMQREDEAFRRANNRPGNGTVKIPIESLAEGDFYKLDGATLRVDHLTMDETGRVQAIELEDGSKYGRQRIERDADGNISIRADEGSLVKREGPNEGTAYSAGDYLKEEPGNPELWNLPDDQIKSRISELRREQNWTPKTEKEFDDLQREWRQRTAPLDRPAPKGVESNRESHTDKAQSNVSPESGPLPRAGRKQSGRETGEAPTDLASALLADARLSDRELASLEWQREHTGESNTRKGTRDINGNLAYLDQYQQTLLAAHEAAKSADPQAGLQAIVDAHNREQAAYDRQYPYTKNRNTDPIQRGFERRLQGSGDAIQQIAARLDEYQTRQKNPQAEFKYASGDFFDFIESDAQASAREAGNKAAQSEREAKAAMLEKAKARLTGKDIDTTREMFGGLTDKRGQQSMFDPGGNDLTGVKTQQIIKEAINEKYDKLTSIGENEGEWNNDVVRRRAESNFNRIRQAGGKPLANTAFDAEFAGSFLGKRIRKIAKLFGADIIFFKGGIETPRGLVDGTRLYLRSNVAAPDLFTVLEHEIVHVRFNQGDSSTAHIVNRVDINSPAAKAIRTQYDRWLEMHGHPKLTDALAREEIAAYHLSGDHRFGVDPSQAFYDQRSAINLALEYHGAKPLPYIRETRTTLGEQLPEKFSAGESHTDQPRPLSEVKTDFADAEAALKDATRKRDDQSQADYKQAAALAAARYRTVRDELKLHPERIAEVLKETQRLSAAAKASREAGNPDWARTLEDELQGHLGDLDRLPKKLVERIQNELISMGELPKMQAMPETDAGRSLDQVTDWLRANGVDSPKKSLVERMTMAGKFAETLQNAKTSLQKSRVKMQAMWRAAVESVKAPPIDSDFRHVIKSWIYSDQRTGLATHQFVRELVKKVSNADRRKAITAWLEADGDAGLLRFQADSVPEAYRKPFELAQKLTADEKAIALKIKADWEMKGEDAQRVGLLEAGQSLENYVPQRWKIKPEIGSDIAGESHGRPGNPFAKLDSRNPFFSFKRETPSYFDGIMSKGVPENMDIAHLVATYDQAFHKSLSSRGMIGALREANAQDGLPIVKISGSARMVSTDGGKTFFVDSKARTASDATADGRSYEPVDHSALRGWAMKMKDTAGNPIMVKGDMLVHPDHVKYLKNELENSGLRDVPLIGSVMRTQAFLKASKLSASAFHLVTIGEHMASHLVNPFLGDFKIDLRQGDQALLVRNGLELGMGGPMANFAEGLSGGHQGLFNKIPGLGDFSAKMTDYMFKDYIPAIMMKGGLKALESNRKRYGDKLTPDQIAELTAHQMNAAGGLLNYRLQGADGNFWHQMGANKTLIDINRMALLAPQFLEARVRVVAQALKPYGMEQRKMLIVQAGLLYVGCRVLNKLINDDPQWNEKNAFAVVIKGRAYSIRTIVGDFWHLVNDPASFAAGRLSPLMKISMENGVMGGRDLRTGARKDIPFDTQSKSGRMAQNIVMDLANWLTPIPVEGFVFGAKGRDQTIPGMMLSSVGVGSRKFTAANQMWTAAADFNRNSPDAKANNYQSNKDNGSFGHSAYAKLDSLLDAEDFSKIRTEYADLLKGRSPGQITTRYGRNIRFTGSSVREQAFYASLDDRQKKIYQQAKAEQQARAATLAKALGRQ